MKKILRSRLTLIVTFMTLFLCLAGAFAPLWMNQCTHRLTESEVKILLQPLEQSQTSYATGSREELVARKRKWLTEYFIPCGVEDLSLEEKAEVANHYGFLYEEPFVPLRTDLDYIDMVNSHPVYYFQVYTFFYIPGFCIRSILPGRLLESYHPTCPVGQESVNP